MAMTMSQAQSFAFETGPISFGLKGDVAPLDLNSDLAEIAAMLGSPSISPMASDPCATFDEGIMGLIFAHAASPSKQSPSPLPFETAGLSLVDDASFPKGWPASGKAGCSADAMDTFMGIETAGTTTPEPSAVDLPEIPDLDQVLRSDDECYMVPTSPSESVLTTTSSEGGAMSDSDSSGGESSSSTHSKRSHRTTMPNGPKVTAGSRAGKAAAPRPRWKCSAKFLIESITEQERTVLAKKVPSLYIPRCASEKLSKLQERELRKQLRKFRNVASAQRSRQNQKVYITDLEERINQCELEKDELAHTNRTLSSSLNDALQQLARLRSTLAGSPSGSATMLMVAVCVGIWAPSQSNHYPATSAAEANSDAYAQPSFRSRSLLSIVDESDTVAMGGGGASSAALVLLMLASILVVVFIVQRVRPSTNPSVARGGDDPVAATVAVRPDGSDSPTKALG